MKKLKRVFHLLLFVRMFTSFAVICIIMEVVGCNSVSDADEPDGKSTDVCPCILESDDVSEGPYLSMGFGLYWLIYGNYLVLKVG